MSTKTKELPPSISEFDLTFPNVSYAKDFVVVLPGKPRRVVVGYLSHDEDCGDPIENCDCSGKIHQDAKGILPLDSNGDPDPSDYEDQAEKEIRFEVRALDPIITEEEIDRRIEDLDDFDARKEVRALELWRDQLDPLVVVLDYRDYGSSGASYHIECLAAQFDYDKTPKAVWVPDECLLEELKSLPESERSSKCLVYAKQAIETMNLWLEGSVYGTVVEVFEDVGDECWESISQDSVWGHIGREWAEQSLKESVDSEVSERLSASVE